MTTINPQNLTRFTFDLLITKLLTKRGNNESVSP